jgi:hypothetical protein
MSAQAAATRPKSYSSLFSSRGLLTILPHRCKLRSKETRTCMSLNIYTTERRELSQ